jgi:hypothetical protein
MLNKGINMDNMELINNPKYTYVYKSPIGIFYIHYNPSFEKWDLGMDGEIFGSYITTIAAADDVYCQATGCNKWDILDISNNPDVPTDIYEWERVPNKGYER